MLPHFTLGPLNTLNTLLKQSWLYHWHYLSLNVWVSTPCKHLWHTCLNVAGEWTKHSWVFLIWLCHSHTQRAASDLSPTVQSSLSHWEESILPYPLPEVQQFLSRFIHTTYVGAINVQCKCKKDSSEYVLCENVCKNVTSIKVQKQ